MQTNQRILNLGSGTNPEKEIVIENPLILNADFERSRIVDIICDAHYLPFREKVFSSAILEHVLEHVHFPFNVLQEVRRVTTKTVIVSVPNLYQWRVQVHEPEDHIYSWSRDSLKHLLQLVYSECTISIEFAWRYHSRLPFIRKLILFAFSFFQPNNLTAKVRMK